MSVTRLDVQVLLVAKLLPPVFEALDQAVILLDGRDREKRAALIAEHGPTIRAIATTGFHGASRELIASLPKLEIISCYTAGIDNIDSAAAAEHGVKVANTSAALADDVADLAIAKCLILLRRYRQADRLVRAGEWRDWSFPLGRSAKGKTLGILGLGAIGKAIARRAEAMGMTIAYSSRTERPELPYRFVRDLNDLATMSDLLVVCCPATPETYHIVDARILEALGPEGYLVNIARGSVIDEPALIAALKANRIAGAGLDVYEKEPDPSPDLVSLETTSLSPHIGSATIETREAMGRMMIDNILDHFRVG